MIRLFYISAPEDAPSHYKLNLETDSLPTAEAFFNLYEGLKGLEINRSALHSLEIKRYMAKGAGGYPIVGFERLSSSPLIGDL